MPFSIRLFSPFQITQARVFPFARAFLPRKSCCLDTPNLNFDLTSVFSRASGTAFISTTKTMPTSNSLVIKFARAVPEASTPSRGSAKAAGYDLKSAEDCVVPARGKQIVNTGIRVQLPEGCYGRIAPRSGLAAKHSIDVGGEME